MGGYCRGGDKGADMERVFERFPRLKERRRQVADRGYVLETGRIVTEGTGTALLESDTIRKAYLGG